MVLGVNVPRVGSHQVAEDSALIGGRLGGIDITDGTFTVAMVAGVFNLKVGGRVITYPPQIDPRCVNVFLTVGPRHIFGLTKGFKGSIIHSDQQIQQAAWLLTIPWCFLSFKHVPRHRHGTIRPHPFVDGKQVPQTVRFLTGQNEELIFSIFRE